MFIRDVVCRVGRVICFTCLSEMLCVEWVEQ